MAIHYCMVDLVFFNVLSQTDTVHVAEDASESAFIRYPGADEIVTGSLQTDSAYMYIIHDTKSRPLDFSSHVCEGFGHCYNN